MCMEDIRLGRDLAVTSQLTLVASGQWVLLAGKDPMRTRFFGGNDNNNVYFIQFGEAAPDVTHSVGWLSNQFHPNLDIRVEQVGKLITSNIWVFTPAINLALYWGTASLEKQ